MNCENTTPNTSFPQSYRHKRAKCTDNRRHSFIEMTPVGSFYSLSVAHTKRHKEENTANSTNGSVEHHFTFLHFNQKAQSILDVNTKSFIAAVRSVSIFIYIAGDLHSKSGTSVNSDGRINMKFLDHANN